MPESKSRKKKSVSAPTSSARVGPNPAWLVPTMVTLMVLGLLWIVVYYISQTQFPVPALGNWNLLVGFVLVIAGFSLTTRWH